MYKEQYILPVFQLLLCFCSWLLISSSVCVLFWNRERKHLTIAIFKAWLLYKKARYRTPVLTCAICWVLGLHQNCTSPVLQEVRLLCWCRGLHAACMKQHSLAWGEYIRLLWIQHYLSLWGCWVMLCYTIKYSKACVHWWASKGGFWRIHQW